MNSNNIKENNNSIVLQSKKIKVLKVIISILATMFGFIWFMLGLTSLFRLSIFSQTVQVSWDSFGGIGGELAPWAILIGIILALIILKCIKKFRTGKLGCTLTYVGCFLLLVSILISWNDGKRVQDSLQKEIGIDYKINIGDSLNAMAYPLKQDMTGLKKINNISYGEYGKDNTLDLIMPEVSKNKRMPILIQVHGGGMISGEKGIESVPLTLKMAKAGWLVVTINYRLAPQNRWPAQIDDVNKAIKWVQEHAKEYGGDPDFIAGVGGSAGGYLLSLAATSHSDHNDKSLGSSPLKAVVSLYGAYDMFKSNLGSDNFRNNVLLKEQKDDKDLWHKVSPIYNINEETPAFYVVHGKLDGLVAIDDAREFVKELRQKSKNTVVYTELLGAHHGFDNQDSLRVTGLNYGIQKFLEYEYSKKVN